MKEDLRVEKSFQFVQEATKQIITLSTFIIGITLTFFENLSQEDDNIKQVFPFTWLLFLLSIVFGFFVLLNLSGTLGNIKDISDEKVSVYRPQIRIWMYTQLLSFFAGLSLAIYTLF